MKKTLVCSVVILGLAAFSPGLIRGEEEAATPGELHRKAHLLGRDAQRAVYQEDLLEAFQAYSEAVSIYEEIARIDPGWRTEFVQSRLEEWGKESDRIGREIFSLPSGVVEIRPGMTREGRRFDEGRAGAARVKETGEDEYEVESFTVTVVREGPLQGASCTCPDYTYRGRKHGFACKHIWAVIARERLLQ